MPRPAIGRLAPPRRTWVLSHPDSGLFLADRHFESWVASESDAMRVSRVEVDVYVSTYLHLEGVILRGSQP